jgi:hypothetical protein
MDFFFGKRASRSKTTPVFNKKTGEPLVVSNYNSKKNMYYTKGKTNASVYKKDRSSGRKTKTNLKFKREDDKIYFVKDGVLCQTQKSKRFL